MTETRINSFNIEPLVFEIENVIKNGLKVLLKDYIDRHDLLERTGSKNLAGLIIFAIANDIYSIKKPN
jgi:hypothetical protein